MISNRHPLTSGKRWVVKIGSSLLTGNGQGLDRTAMASWVSQLAALRGQGVEILLVSSGAVAEGMVRLGWSKRPTELHQLQAAAALGQMGLVQAWESAFQQHQMHTAQILLTHDDLSNRRRYLNARTTLRSLLKLGIVPVINENDTVVTDEIRFGDNDTLAALVANLVEADALVILTDQPGMFDTDPRKNADAKLLDVVRADDPDVINAASGSSGELGRGGMITKVGAARVAARSGAVTLIGGGAQTDILLEIRKGTQLGTLFMPGEAPLDARKRWLAGQLNAAGSLTLDAGAIRVLREQGRSLLSVGVREVEGHFQRGDLVILQDEGGAEIGRGLVNYNDEESRKLRGQPSDRIEPLLGYAAEPELVHRDNLVLL